ncbi:MAG: YbhB/YbcL family Raf kinase inhibitor-like protein [Proteobacteria bacterium]|nr:YbhB/YbcL family Raf kinase inhibitor-like protein [Pseudomonadota bacterium]MBU1232950.1 YbhB/YbcL family Raf kinase inhibitor-like protein [Pseudomonadota bacterium]MBU1418691.1 YbhB/YbcL family Raf kinase inhibitor-like protein [Pseudomonadota bacterium]MBU1454437.1 YbhB/YbcL family Raf kinase inhibitor-like protein [Pseudomonadota bacterium]
MTMKLTSDAFFHRSEIPSLYTCDGLDISPPLDWSELPPDTKSMTLIVYDPDAPDPAAPQMIWVHWILYNLPIDCSGLEQGISNSELPPGTKEGLNSWCNTNYGGPCPPIGRHRYFFKLSALETVLPDLDRPNKTKLEKYMRGHVLEETELMGTYQR